MNGAYLMYAIEVNMLSLIKKKIVENTAINILMTSLLNVYYSRELGLLYDLTLKRGLRLVSLIYVLKSS